MRHLAPGIGAEACAQVVRDADGWASVLVSGAHHPGTDGRAAQDRSPPPVLRALPEDAHRLLSATSDEPLIDAPTALALTGDEDAAGTSRGWSRTGSCCPTRSTGGRTPSFTEWFASSHGRAVRGTRS